MREGPEFKMIDIPPRLLEEIKRLEYLKTFEETKAIEFANKITNELITGCGIAPHDFTQENIHIFPQEIYKKTTGSGSGGRADHIRQAVILNVYKVRNKGNLRFANATFHEMLHIKSFVSLTQEDGMIAFKQRGLEIDLQRNSYDKDEIYARMGGKFGGLNEAIVAHYERYFVAKALENDLFKEERDWLDTEEAKEIKIRIAQRENYSEQDIYTVTKEGTFDTHGYATHEKVLLNIANKILKDNPERFMTSEEVVKEFLKAMINGDTSEIKNLVEKSFGPKSFRTLGMMKEDRESAQQALEYFR